MEAVNQNQKTEGNKMTTLKIKSHHRSLSSAVAELNPDLSYNVEVAKNHIRDIDLNCRQAVVTACGEVYYVSSFDIDLLHKFTPFQSMMTDSPFRVAFIAGNQIIISESSVPKTKESRNWFKNEGKAIGALAA